MSVRTERDANPRNGTTQRPAKNAATPGLLLLLACGAMFLVILDATIVSVALPAIGSELGFGAAELGWVVNAYTLTFVSFLLLGGRLADLFGTRLLLVTGLVVFTVANLCSGLAASPAQLVTARAVQGFGGALLMPATLTVVHQAYGDPVRRARALGLWSMVGAVGAAAGTVLGGVLTDVFGWRWVFGIKVPLGLAVAVTGWLALPRRAATESDQARRRIDVVGALLVTAGLAALVHGVVTLRATGTREAAFGSLVAPSRCSCSSLSTRGVGRATPLCRCASSPTARSAAPTSSSSVWASPISPAPCCLRSTCNRCSTTAPPGRDSASCPPPSP